MKLLLSRGLMRNFWIPVQSFSVGVPEEPATEELNTDIYLTES